MKKTNNKKGFTLAELLVVVAIIGVLVAISIPIFTQKLDDAKKATDEANMRSAKAAAVNAYLTDHVEGATNDENSPKEVKYVYDAKNGKVVSDGNPKNITGYNEYVDSSDGRNKKGSAVVQVTITARGDSVEAEWVTGKQL